MRILAVTPYYAPEGGGLERYAHMILTQLARRGHCVHALAATRRSESFAYSGGVSVSRWRAPFTIGNTPIDLSLRRRIGDAIRDLDPDVVVAHTPVPYAAEMAWLAARRARRPFVTTYHGGRLRGSSPLLEKIAAVDRLTFERAMLAGSRGLIAVTPYVRDHALARHRGRVHVIPPGVDRSLFRAAPPPQEDHILFVGPLAQAYRWKGIDVLWDAFAQLYGDRKDLRLTIVGEGDRRAEFAAKAAAYGDAVRLVGRLDERALARAYREASVVVLPSVTDAESFGMVLAEANACGRPVVASRIGGMPDFVRDGENGLLAAPGDARDLAAKIGLVLADAGRAEAMGRRGSERVRREHDWGVLARATEAVLEDAAATPAS